jgi:hypothetical protein
VSAIKHRERVPETPVLSFMTGAVPTTKTVAMPTTASLADYCIGYTTRWLADVLGPELACRWWNCPAERRGPISIRRRPPRGQILA